MVNYLSPAIDSTFSSLSDPTRRAILGRLSLGKATVTEVAQPFNMSLPAISKHLKVLENAGLISRVKKGRNHKLKLETKRLKMAFDWIMPYRQFWDKQLEALAKEGSLWKTLKI